MKKTTRVKIFLKKHSPDFLFDIIFSINKIFTKIFAAIPNFKVRKFKEEQVIRLVYFDKTYDLVINPKNKGIDHELFLFGVYELDILGHLLNSIKKGDTVIDVGANIGHHSIFMSRCVGECGKVFAFEPIPSLYEQFIKSVQLNNLGNINLFKCAIGDSEKEEKIYVDGDNIATSSIVKNHNIKNLELIIPVKTLDSFNILNPKLIKIDVEGYEYNVLQGGKKTIETYHPIIILEYSPLFYEQYNKAHIKKIVEFLRENRYRIYDLEDGNKEIVDDNEFINSFKTHMRSQTNILCK